MTMIGRRAGSPLVTGGEIVSFALAGLAPRGSGHE